MNSKILRNAGSASSGNSFSDATKVAVWNKGRIITGVNPGLRRQDRCGAWIDWNQYGVTADFGNGWEIDHIVPVAIGGSDDLSNLQPLQWQNNRAKSDGSQASATCPVIAKR